MWYKRFFQKIRSRVRQGKAFETMTRTALKRLAADKKNHIWFQRIWDYQTFMRLNPNFHAVKQPADFMGSVHGKIFMIECKSSQARRFDPKYLRPYQFTSMKELWEKSALYWIFILKRGDSPKEHKFFVYDYPSWMQLLREVKRTPYKTADWDMIQMYAKMEIFRKNRTWNLKPLFDLSQQKLS